jgi:hypothetical protein
MKELTGEVGDTILPIVRYFRIMCIYSLKKWPKQYYSTVYITFFFPWLHSPSGPGPPHRGFMITLNTTLGRTPLDEGPARDRDLYLTTHNTHKRQTSIPTARYKPAIPGSERPQTHALHSAATGIGK